MMSHGQPKKKEYDVTWEMFHWCEAQGNVFPCLNCTAHNASFEDVFKYYWKYSRIIGSFLLGKENRYL